MSLATDQKEQEKWDDYYAGQTVVPEDPEIEAFYSELADAMLRFLSPGSDILEAGCGGGMHSLALARQGGCRVSLMDFSGEAIEFARKVFAAARLEAAFEIGDVFAATGIADQDLVFNSGVLEHYEFTRQVAFLKGMARRSRRHVFVLVPNRECYWYWVWRIQSASAGQWPFGYEKPAGDYRAAIEAAGLHYLGKAYFGARAVNRFLAGLEGLSPQLRQLIEKVHDGEVISAGQRSYLVGFLAAVVPDLETPPGFTAGSDDRAYLDSDRVDRYVALLGDSLASQIAAERRRAVAEALLAEARRQQQKLEAANRALSVAASERRQPGATSWHDPGGIARGAWRKLAAATRSVTRMLRR